MGATVYDVAREAGVSMKTAARVLAGEKTRSGNTERVLAAAGKLGYVRNASAAKLARKKHKSLGVIIPSLTNPFFAFFAETLFRQAHARGFQVLLEHSFGHPEEEARCLRSFLEYSVSGVILNVSENPQPPDLKTWLPLFCSRGIPLIAAGCPAKKLGGWDIRIRNSAGMQRVVDHLVSRGHHRIAFLAGAHETIGNRERLNGFSKAMTGHGLDPSLVRQGAFTAESGRDIALELLRSRSRPSAIVAMNDIMALGAYQAAYECGLRIPVDVAIVGFDDVPLSSLACPPLTTVRQPQEKIAEDCIALIEESYSSGQLPESRSFHYDVSLIVRGSA